MKEGGKHSKAMQTRTSLNSMSSVETVQTENLLVDLFFYEDYNISDKGKLGQDRL